MSLHPTMAAALAPFAPPQSEVHKIAEQAIPGVEAFEVPMTDFVNSLAGSLELLPTEKDEHTKKLERAGFAGKPSLRNDWAASRAETDNAHRNEVNS